MVERQREREVRNLLPESERFLLVASLSCKGRRCIRRSHGEEGKLGLHNPKTTDTVFSHIEFVSASGRVRLAFFHPNAHDTKSKPISALELASRGAWEWIF
jgi:hypothetical protein